MSAELNEQGSVWTDEQCEGWLIAASQWAEEVSATEGFKASVEDLAAEIPEPVIYYMAREADRASKSKVVVHAGSILQVHVRAGEYRAGTSY